MLYCALCEPCTLFPPVFSVGPFPAPGDFLSPDRTQRNMRGNQVESMSFICGLQSAVRNHVFFRFNSLANWRKCNTLASTSEGCHQVVNKSQGLGVNQCDRWTLLPGNFHFYRTFNNKKTGCLSSTKSKEIWMNASKYTVWKDSFSRQLLIKKVRAVPSLLVLHPLSPSPVRAIRNFHTSPRFQAAPVPLLLMILKPVQKLLAIIVGSGWKNLKIIC